MPEALAGGTRYRYSLNSVFLVLAILISVSASLRSCLRNAAKPSRRGRRRHHRLLVEERAMNFGSLNSFWNSLEACATIAGGVPFGAARPHQPWPG